MKIIRLNSNNHKGRHLSVSVAPEIGASLLRFAIISEDGNAIDIMQPADKEPNLSKVSMFFTIPWFARLQNAEFPYEGEIFKTNHQKDPKFAIHGITRLQQFAVLSESSDKIVMQNSFQSGAEGVQFPVPFRTTISLSVKSNDNVHTLLIEKSVQNTGEKEAPFVMADHPFIEKRINGELPFLKYDATSWFPVKVDALLPTGEALNNCPGVSATGPDTFPPDKPWSIQPGWWEFGTHGWSGEASAEWVKAGIKLIIRDEDGTSPFLQVWIPPDEATVKGKLESSGRGCFGMEPLTGIADAARLKHEGCPLHGATLLGAGETLSTRTSYSVVIS